MFFGFGQRAANENHHASLLIPVRSMFKRQMCDGKGCAEIVEFALNLNLVDFPEDLTNVICGSD